MSQINFSEYRQLVHASKQARIDGDRLYAAVRTISALCSYSLLRVFPRIRPNHISLTIVLLVGLIIASNLYSFSHPDHLVLVLQLLLLQLASLGDRVDGEIARYQQHFTQRGIYYDRLFHFLYPFALYLSVGNYFGWSMLSVLLAILATLVLVQGKLRHHIKFKIMLEGHQAQIRDLYEGASSSLAPAREWRFFYYLVFMIYDWVWGFYLALIILGYFLPLWAANLYMTHALVSIVWFSYYLLVTYPGHALFSKQDFQL